MSRTDGSEPTIQELFRLEGRTAMVTGAAGYLGASLARALAEAGASVIATSRQMTKAQRLVAGLPRTGEQRHLAITMDQLDEPSIRAAFEAAVESAGSIDILVNNGQAAALEDWTTVSHEQFTQQMANAAGYFVLARELRNHAVSRGQSASIVMVGSMYGLVGSYPSAYESICNASPVAYHALKGGVLQMSRHLAVYWAPDRVRVNCLCPGPFPDPDRVTSGLVTRLTNHVPLKRMGAPFELKGAVVFLASEASSYMTGQTLVIDGGWTAW